MRQRTEYPADYRDTPPPPSTHPRVSNFFQNCLHHDHMPRSDGVHGDAPAVPVALQELLFHLQCTVDLKSTSVRIQVRVSDRGSVKS